MSSGEELEAADDAATDAEELTAQIEVLQEQNRRLREEYRRARKTEYRQTALGFALLGVVALGAAVVFPGSREILLAFAGTGLFAAILTRSLTPEQFIAAPVGKHVYDAHDRTGTALVGDLGLSERRLYLPAGTDGDPSNVRLFVPQTASVDPPAPEDIDPDGAFSVSESHRGLFVHPTGAGLYEAFETDLNGPPAEEPTQLRDQMVDALVDGFEIVDAATADVEDGRLSVQVRGSAYGDVDGFDHPVSSFLAVAVSHNRDAPVSVDTDEDDGRYDGVVTVRWESSSSTA